MARQKIGVKRRLSVFALQLLVLANIVFVIAMSGFRVQTPPGFGGVAELPDTPSAEQFAADKAAKSTVGRVLIGQGYTSTTTVPQGSDLEKWLVEQQKHSTPYVPNVGPYAIFSKGQPQAPKPGEGAPPPDILVDTTNLVTVGLYQAYTDKRGAACFYAGDPRILQAHWVHITVYLQGKSLNQTIPVSHNNLPQFPKSMGTVQCYTVLP